ncbi:hypothetical protein PULV_a3052 [Pseudoalteromonas ulvae UL12]|uniref:hypothetical protein n=1 Tax=Pseudoalteromonas ulvae TaxID=107327 RepID=UPI00186B75F6|nr:hypothetical protein [Pseudoalteromonas ulvae]MBE0362420.1 hypothetical protein [Pseudoalteromonas ulvae UL12]
MKQPVQQLIFILMLMTLVACGGGSSDSDVIEEPIKENNYSDEDSANLLLAALVLVEGVIEVNELVEAEFLYVYFSSESMDSRVCANNGEVTWNRDNLNWQNGHGALELQFENCLVSSSFMFNGKVSINYTLNQFTDNEIKPFLKKGLEKFSLSYKTDGLEVSPEDGSSEPAVVKFDIDNSIEQLWDIDDVTYEHGVIEKNKVESGDTARTFTVNSFSASLLSEKEELRSVTISQKHLAEVNYASDNHYNLEVDGDFVYGGDNSIWKLNAGLNKSSSDHASGSTTIENETDSVRANFTMDGYANFTYNNANIGSAWFPDVFDGAIWRSRNVWGLFLEQVYATKLKVLTQSINLEQINEQAQIEIEFSAPVHSQGVRAEDLSGYPFRQIDSTTNNNKLSFDSGLLLENEIIYFSASAQSIYAGEGTSKGFAVDVLERGEFVHIPKPSVFVPGKNLFFYEENSYWQFFDITGEMVYKKEHLTSIYNACVDSQTGNLLISGKVGGTDSIFMLDMNGYSLKDLGSKQESIQRVALRRSNNSNYCREIAYGIYTEMAEGGNPTSDYLVKFNNLTNEYEQYLLQTEPTGYSIIENPKIEKSVISGGLNLSGLIIGLYSNLGGELSREEFQFSFDHLEGYHNHNDNSVFLEVDEAGARLFAHNLVLNLENLNEIIHEFSGTENVEIESILRVREDLGLIVTTEGVYDLNNYEKLKSLSFLKLKPEQKVFDVEKQLYIALEKNMIFKLDLTPYSSK